MLSPTLGAAAAVHSACAFVLTSVLTQRMLTTGPDEDQEQRTRARMLHVAVAGALLWPFVWVAALGPRARTTAPALFGLLWPLAAIGMDMRGITVNEVTAQNNNVVQGLQADSNSLIGIAFAFGTLSLSGQFTAFRRLTFTLVMFALIICIAFVIPAPVDRSKTTHYGMVTAVGQRVLFQYAAGFIITAMMLSVVSALRE